MQSVQHTTSVIMDEEQLPKNKRGKNGRTTEESSLVTEPDRITQHCERVLSVKLLNGSYAAAAAAADQQQQPQHFIDTPLHAFQSLYSSQDTSFL